MENDTILQLPNYENLKNELTFILNDENEIFTKLDNRKIRILIKTIEKSSNNIIAAMNFYKEDRLNKFSLNDLYEKSFYYGIGERNNLYTTILNNSNIVKGFSATELMDLYRGLTTKINLIDFYKERRFMSSKAFSTVKTNASKNDIQYAINNINIIINNEFAFLPPLINSRYTDDFIKENIYIYNINNLPASIIKEINKKNNGHLIAPYQEVNYFNIKNLFTNIKLIFSKKRVYNLYNSLEVKILNEYIENLSNIDFYKNSFSFLRKILVEDKYNKLHKVIVNSTELQNWLKSIKKTLLKYLNYSNITSKVSQLNDNEKLLIDFCFTNTKSYTELNNLIKHIPIYCINENIIELEKEYTDYFNPKFFNSNFKIAYNSFKNLKNILFKYYENLDHLENIALILETNPLFKKPYQTFEKTSNIIDRSILEKRVTTILKSLKYTFVEISTPISEYSLIVNSPVSKDRFVQIYFIHNTAFDINDLLNTIICTENYDNILFVNYSDFWNDERVAIINLKNTLNNILCN